MPGVPCLCGVRFDFEDALERECAERLRERAAARAAERKGGGGGGVRRTVCKHFMRGLCSAGEACTFLHQVCPERVAICTFYQEGRCNRGAECVFRHVGDIVQACDLPSPPPPPPPPPPPATSVQRARGRPATALPSPELSFVMCFEDSNSESDDGSGGE